MLSFHNVAKSFGHIQAIHQLSFQCRAGEVLGVLGPNGAGKSTAIALAVGIATPNAGTIQIQLEGNNISPNDRRARAALGFASQQPALYPGLTVAENLAFFARVLHHRPPKRRELQKRIRTALENASLTAVAKRRVRKLSHGTIQRLNLAAALIHQPALVLLDEPTAGLDPPARRTVHDTVSRLRDEGRAILYTTHHMDEAERLCDRILLLHTGHTIAIDTVTNIIHRAHQQPHHHAPTNPTAGQQLEHAFFALTNTNTNSKPNHTHNAATHTNGAPT